MEVLNKSSDTYKRAKTIGPAVVSFQKRSFYLSGSGVVLVDAKPGDLIHFMPDNDRLYFYIDNSNKAGFQLRSRNKMIALYFEDKTLLEILYRRFQKANPGTKFPIRKLVTKINGLVGWEVMLHKRVTKQ